MLIELLPADALQTDQPRLFITPARKHTAWTTASPFISLTSMILSMRSSETIRAEPFSCKAMVCPSKLVRPDIGIIA